MTTETEPAVGVVDRGRTRSHCGQEGFYSVGPNFGIESLLDTIANSSTPATLVSEQTPLVWPAGHDLRRIPLHDPAPVHPHSLIWRTDNPHPALIALRDHLTSAYPGRPNSGLWTPKWD